MTTPTAVKFASVFHDTYERLAPEFGYETRSDTREFDEQSPNGRLMIATCEQVLGWMDSENIA